MNFNENEFIVNQQNEMIHLFNRKIQEIERTKEQELLAQGWKRFKSAARTVAFTFGEVTFSRKCYRKGSEFKYPVDEELKLDPYARYSHELLFQIAEMATEMPYRKVAQTFEKLKNIYITKDTVLKAVKFVANLYAENQEYCFLKNEEIMEKKYVEQIYIEGDGILINTKNGADKRTDLAHFVVHTGCEKEYKGRKKLMNKYEVIRKDNRTARKEVMDYLYNTYDMGSVKMVITNSDMGHGYTPHIFEELAAPFRYEHEHFWDAYHLNKMITETFRKISEELRQRLMSAVYSHSKKKTQLILDTAESMLEEEEEIEKFQLFSRKLLRELKYTEPAKSRGFSHEGIGIMESQHCKIANRMKKKGMYWSVEGAETMARMIIDVGNGTLRDLFFGDWGEEYAQAQITQVTNSAAKYVKNRGKGGSKPIKSGNVSFSNKNIK